MKNLKTTLLIIFCAFTYMNALAQPAGNSLLLDGINNYVSVPDNLALDFTDSMSVEVWVNVSLLDTSEEILTKSWCGNDQFGYEVAIDSGKIIFGWAPNGDCGVGGNIYHTDSVVISPFVCTHVGIVFKLTGITVYVNGNLVPGSLVAGSYTPIENSSEPLRIGVYKALNTTLRGYFSGEMDELRIWNYCLTASEINTRMNIALTGNEPGLVAYYNFEEPGIGNGFTVVNQCTATGSVLDGTTIGSPTSPSHIPRCSTVGINESEIGADAVIVYPNPSNGTFTIDFGKSIESKTHSLIVRNILSQKVFEANNKQQKTEINLNRISTPGIYFLEVRNDERVIVDCKKIIVD